MAAPSYTSDLTSNVIYEDSENFSTVGGGRVTDAETDDYIQGSNCWSHDPFSSGTEGGVHDTVSGESIAADDAVFIWMKCDVAATIATHAAGGMAALIGNSTSNLKVYYVRGSDDYQYGGWICVPIDPTITPSTNIGSPSGTWDHFGVQWYVPGSGASKGYPMKIDAMRHGRQIEVTAGDSGTPATWSDLAAYDATSTRQWGICQPNDAGVELQGIVYWGTASTAAYFDDSSGETVVLIDTEWTSTDFTKIIIEHADSVYNMDGITIKALGTNNPGQFIYNNASTTSALKNNTFDSIGITTLRAGVTATDNKWKQAGAVTQNAATITGCIFDKASGAVSLDADDIDSVTECIFNSDGSNHAVDLGTFGANDSVSWSNYLVDYASSDGSTGNEAITVDVGTGVTLTINVSAGYDVPSVRNTNGSPGTVTKVSSVSLTISGLPANTEVTIVKTSDRSELHHTENSSGNVVYAYGAAEVGLEVDILIHHIDYDPNIGNYFDYILPSADTPILVNLISDETYYNPT